MASRIGQADLNAYNGVFWSDRVLDHCTMPNLSRLATWTTKVTTWSRLFEVGLTSVSSDAIGWLERARKYFGYDYTWYNCLVTSKVVRSGWTTSTGRSPSANVNVNVSNCAVWHYCTDLCAESQMSSVKRMRCNPPQSKYWRTFYESQPKCSLVERCECKMPNSKAGR